MKQFDLQGNEYDCTIEIPLKKATYEDIQALNINLQTQLFVKDKEIERLNNIINKIDRIFEADTHCEDIYYAIGVLLNKEYFDIELVDNEELLNILGSDKE